MSMIVSVRAPTIASQKRRRYNTHVCAYLRHRDVPDRKEHVPRCYLASFAYFLIVQRSIMSAGEVQSQSRD